MHATLERPDGCKLYYTIDDCTDPSGDPVVVYDQLADRWILSQFTTRGLDDPALPFYNCVAVSTTGDPTGSYYRYAFTTGLNFPDYPKYGVWTDSYVITTREFGPTVEYGIGVYALDKNNEKLVSADMKKKVDAAKADIISGKIKVADYMADNACKY